jgi:hypothetical protein
VQAFSVGRSEDPFRGLFEALYPKLVSYFAVRGLDLQVAERTGQDALMTSRRMALCIRRSPGPSGPAWAAIGDEEGPARYARDRSNQSDADRQLISKPL